MKRKIRTLVVSALFAALICVATMIIKIPTPLKGYINLGDCAVLLAGWLLPLGYSFLAAGIGSALADIFSGYFIYAPATFVIKGLTAVTAFLLFRVISRKAKDIISAAASGVASEIIMVAGYYIFEGFMYGFGASVVNILPNVFQAAAGITLGVLLFGIFRKTKIRM